MKIENKIVSKRYIFSGSKLIQEKDIYKSEIKFTLLDKIKLFLTLKIEQWKN
jgi:hypothetical protein